VSASARVLGAAAPRLAQRFGETSRAVAKSSGAASAVDVSPVPREEKSRLANAMARGTFVVAVELLPPRGYQTDEIVERARRLKIGGVDLVCIPDGPRVGARISALSLAVLIEQRAGIETLLQYSCRDRNLLGIQSDLLGAHAMGLRNLMLVTGDPGRVGDYPDATAVFDVDSIGLTNLVSNLNRGLDPGGNAIGQPTRFAIGVGVNPVAIDLDQELKRFDWKVEAGAEYAITQPVFDALQLEKFFGRINSAHIPIIAGIWPLVSVRNAEFLANEVPGVSVPDEIISRMRRANEKSKEHAVAEGIAIAREMLDRIRPLVQGVQVSAPFGKVELALEVFGSGL
jgi:methionine synthase / methylenetetrahydrofolate reductase(NADPH)